MEVKEDRSQSSVINVTDYSAIVEANKCIVEVHLAASLAGENEKRNETENSEEEDERILYNNLKKYIKPG